MLSKHFPEIERKSIVIPPPPVLQMSSVNGDAGRELGRAVMGINTYEFVVGYFGYIYPSKGVETLLEAFKVVTSQRNA